MVANRAWGSQIQPRMLHLLQSCLTRQSTDPRDRFCAVLGLASDARDLGNFLIRFQPRESSRTLLGSSIRKSRLSFFLMREANSSPQRKEYCVILISLFRRLLYPIGIVERSHLGSIGLVTKLEHRYNHAFILSREHSLSTDSWNTWSARLSPSLFYPRRSFFYSVALCI
jgi:hypothetical protein